jgi:hypothetical protein
LLETNFDAGTCLCVTYALCADGSYSVCSASAPDGGIRVLPDGALVDVGVKTETDAALDAVSEATADAADAGTSDAILDASEAGDAGQPDVLRAR